MTSALTEEAHTVEGLCRDSALTARVPKGPTVLISTQRSGATFAVCGAVAVIGVIGPLDSSAVAHAENGQLRAGIASGNPHDWPMYNHDPEGTRWNRVEHRLGPRTVAGLSELWRFSTEGAVAGTPAVVHDTVYLVDSSATAYAIGHDGAELRAPSRRTDLARPQGHRQPVGDQRNGRLRRPGGLRAWSRRWYRGRALAHPPEPAPGSGDLRLSDACGAKRRDRDSLNRGTVRRFSRIRVLHVPRLGRPPRSCRRPPDLADVLVGEPAENVDGSFGPSGSPVWSTPTYDRASDTLYVTTGNNYSEPSTQSSDAIVAWMHQPAASAGSTSALSATWRTSPLRRRIQTTPTSISATRRRSTAWAGARS